MSEARKKVEKTFSMEKGHPRINWHCANAASYSHIQFLKSILLHHKIRLALPRLEEVLSTQEYDSSWCISRTLHPSQISTFWKNNKSSSLLGCFLLDACQHREHKETVPREDSCELQAHSSFLELTIADCNLLQVQFSKWHLNLWRNLEIQLWKCAVPCAMGILARLMIDIMAWASMLCCSVPASDASKSGLATEMYRLYITVITVCKSNNWAKAKICEECARRSEITAVQCNIVQIGKLWSDACCGLLWCSIRCSLWCTCMERSKPTETIPWVQSEILNGAALGSKPRSSRICRAAIPASQWYHNLIHTRTHVGHKGRPKLEDKCH